LVVTVVDSSFETGRGTLNRATAQRLALIASQLSSRRNLTIAVEGFTDERGNGAEQRTITQRRAQEVRAALVLNGLAPEAVEAAGLGGTHPIMSNATAGGREQNRRVEIVISSPSIGTMALWDRTYSLTSRH
jgi:outer membrane protein OmpA-like peptidoglycan-associated protein